MDFVAGMGEKLLAIEVKAAAAPRRQDSQELRLFREEYREARIGGLLLHGGTDTFWLSEGILCAPGWRVM